MRILLAACLIAVAGCAAAYDWEYVGMSGVATTCIEQNPFHDRILVGTLEGFWIYDLDTQTWSEFDDEGWIGRQVHAITADVSAPQRIITGRENAFFKGYIELSEDGGATGTPVHMSDGGSIVSVVAGYEGFYACGISDITPGELLYSTDGAAPWTPITGHGHTAMTAVAVGMAEDLFVAGDNQVTVSFDWGATWLDASLGLPDELMRCMETYHGEGDVIYTGLLVGSDSGLWLYQHYEYEWRQILADESCRNATMMWGPAPWPLSRVNQPAVVTADGRVLVAQNYADVWDDETGDLPSPAVDLVFADDDRYLYVATAADGVFRFRPTVSAAEDLPVIAAPALEAWPNPFNPRATLRYTLPREATGRLAVYDLAGRLVTVLFSGTFPAGDHTRTWNAAGEASGVYVARLETDQGVAATRMVLVR